MICSTPLSPLIRRVLRIGAVLSAVCLVSSGVWVQWGGWPDPHPEEFSGTPDAIVVLGGGNQRGHKAFLIHQRFPAVPVVITGDGGEIFDDLIRRGVPRQQLLHEEKATSTYENATLTAPILDACSAGQVVLITDWFHMPRALAVFRHVQATRETHPMFFPHGKVLSAAEVAGQRRERVAALAYWARYGINSFAP